MTAACCHRAEPAEAEGAGGCEGSRTESLRGQGFAQRLIRVAPLSIGVACQGLRGLAAFYGTTHARFAAEVERKAEQAYCSFRAILIIFGYGRRTARAEADRLSAVMHSQAEPARAYAPTERSSPFLISIEAPSAKDRGPAVRTGVRSVLI